MLVAIAAGGWRNWRNLLLAGLAALIVAGPYYAVHLDEVFDVGQESTVGSEIGATGTAFDRDARISFDNLTWYAWSAINEQYFVPLLLLFVTGFALAVRELRRRRHLPELLAGVVVTYLLLALVLSIRDARYIAPLVVYVAVISTGWMTTVSASLGPARGARRPRPRLRGERRRERHRAGAGPAPALAGQRLQLRQRRRRVHAARRPRHLRRRARRRPALARPARRRPRRRRPDGDGREPRGAGLGHRPDRVLRHRGRLRDRLDEAGGAPPDLEITTWVTDANYVGEMGYPPACATIEEGASLYDGDPVLVHVLAQRRNADGQLERWCEF